MDKEDRDRLIRIEESLKDLPDLIKKVEKHDRILWVLSGVSVFFSSIMVIFSADWIFSLIKGK